jgi:hypothetical protein
MGENSDGLGERTLPNIIPAFSVVVMISSVMIA